MPSRRYFLYRKPMNPIAMIRRWGCAVIVIVGLWVTIGWSLLPANAVPLEAAVPLEDAQVLFSIECAGCHPGGGNIIRRGKTLKLRALKRNGLDSIETIATFIAQGKGNMSAYRDRLTPAQIEAIATYVWEQAQHNWKP